MAPNEGEDIMAYYLVRAQPNPARLAELRSRLDSGEIRVLRPFGAALHEGLDGARVAEDGWVVWEEEDYCRPPLAMERAAVLDTYFIHLGVEPVPRGEGWARIAALPSLWADQRA
jgi:hypothetical protein